MPRPLGLQLGPEALRYGKFILYHSFVPFDDGREIPTEMYVIHLDTQNPDILNGAGSGVRLINKAASDRASFVRQIAEWLRGQRMQIESGRQHLQDATDPELSDGLRRLLSWWESRYRAVDEALSELMPAPQ